MPDETFADPRLGPPGFMHQRIPQGQSTGLVDGWYNPLRWFGKTVTYVTELRRFNTFKRDPAGTEPREQVAATTGNPRRAQRKDGLCWEEEQVTIHVEVRTKTLILGYYEYWSVNTTLESYLDGVLGNEGLTVNVGVDGTAGAATIGAGVLKAQAAATAADAAAAGGVAGTAGEMSATALAAGSGALATTAGVAGALGFGVLVFQGTTWIFVRGTDTTSTEASEEKITDGWEIDHIEYGDWEVVDRRTEWRQITEPHPCAPDEPSAGGGALPETGSVVDPPAPPAPPDTPPPGPPPPVIEGPPDPLDGISTPVLPPPPPPVLPPPPEPPEPPGPSRVRGGDGAAQPRWFGLPPGLWLAIVVIVVLGPLVFLLLTGGEDAVDPAAALDTTTAPTSDEPTAATSSTSPPSSPSPSPSPAPPPYDGVVGTFADSLGVPPGIGWTPDPSGDLIYSVSDEAAGHTPQYADIVRAWAAGGPWDTAVLDDLFPCGDGPSGQVTVCADGNPPLDGPVALVAVELAAPVPSDSEDSLIYAVVSDSDGNPANDYQPSAPYDWDYFTGTDHWWELAVAPGGEQWTLTSTDTRQGLTRGNAPSAARAAITGNAIVWLLPLDDFDTAAPTVRATAFATDGSFAPETSGGDVLPGPPSDAYGALPITMVAPGGAGEAGPGAAIRSFYADFAGAIAAGDGAFLYDHLAPEVLDRYGADQCRAYVDGLAQPGFDAMVIGISGAAPWDYTQDDIVTSIASAYAVSLEVGVDGTTTAREAHVVLDGQTVRWFTDCGDPA